jgi:hypothetical protein
VNFRTDCDHEKCQVLADLAQRHYEAMRDDPQLQRLIELDEELMDAHDAVFKVIEHMSIGLLAASIQAAMVEDFYHEHRN